jgi:hypothetical protein
VLLNIKNIKVGDLVSYTPDNKQAKSMMGLIVNRVFGQNINLGSKISKIECNVLFANGEIRRVKHDLLDIVQVF